MTAAASAMRPPVVSSRSSSHAPMRENRKSLVPISRRRRCRPASRLEHALPHEGRRRQRGVHGRAKLHRDVHAQAVQGQALFSCCERLSSPWRRDPRELVHQSHRRGDLVSMLPARPRGFIRVHLALGQECRVVEGEIDVDGHTTGPGGGRTRTTLAGQGILNPLRLPIPPPGQPCAVGTYNNSLLCPCRIGQNSCIVHFAMPDFTTNLANSRSI